MPSQTWLRKVRHGDVAEGALFNPFLKPWKVKGQVPNHKDPFKRSRVFL